MIELTQTENTDASKIFQYLNLLLVLILVYDWVNYLQPMARPVRLVEWLEPATPVLLGAPRGGF